MKKILRWWWALLYAVTFLSCNVEACSNNDTKGKSGLKIACWNVQTFFDSQTTGCEYSEFKNSEHWTEEKYRERLSRLCQFITSVSADVYIFEEIENQGILNDIYNQLAGSTWDSKKMWTYGAFAKEENSAIGIAVLSRLPLEELTIHTLDIRTQKETQPSSRPIVELKLLCEEKTLLFFINHWKSKASGEGNGEIWRQWQESVLCSQILEASQNCDSPNIIACGDFNRDIKNFTFSNSTLNCNTLLRGITSQPAVTTLPLYSPWLESDATFTTSKGSYFYNDNWERIDHIFTSPEIMSSGFRVLDEEPYANEDGKPDGYKVYTGNGYSDHFPLVCNIFF